MRELYLMFWMVVEVLLGCLLAAGVVLLLVTSDQWRSAFPAKVPAVHRYPDMVWMENYSENANACWSALELLATTANDHDAWAVIDKYNECLIVMEVAI